MGECDVIVIGAGAAGLGAARRLSAAGLAVRVLEARNRLGGRAWTARDPSGLPIELGCAWLHSADENELCAIAIEAGLTIDKTRPPIRQIFMRRWGACSRGSMRPARPKPISPQIVCSIRAAGGTRCLMPPAP